MSLKFYFCITIIFGYVDKLYSWLWYYSKINFCFSSSFLHSQVRVKDQSICQQLAFWEHVIYVNLRMNICMCYVIYVIHVKAGRSLGYNVSMQLCTWIWRNFRRFGVFEWFGFSNEKYPCITNEAQARYKSIITPFSCDKHIGAWLAMWGDHVNGLDDSRRLSDWAVREIGGWAVQLGIRDVKKLDCVLGYDIKMDVYPIIKWWVRIISMHAFFSGSDIT